MHYLHLFLFESPETRLQQQFACSLQLPIITA